MPLRCHYLFASVAAALLLLAIFHHSGGFESWEKSKHLIQDASILRPWDKETGRPSFHDIALKHGTDKVTVHQFWYLYDKYLPAVRDRKIKMLEIGLGCNMVSTPLCNNRQGNIFDLDLSLGIRSRGIKRYMARILSAR